MKTTKKIISSIKSKADRQYIGQTKKDKNTNHGKQNNTQKTKDWATWNPLKSRGWTSGACLVTIIGQEHHRVIVTGHEHHLIWEFVFGHQYT